MKKVILFVFLVTSCQISFSQDIDYARMIIDSLCSVRMEGRGYVNHGDSIAASFIKNQFLTYGLKPLKDSYYQPFNISVNTFPGKVLLMTDNKLLTPGEDYMISASSPSISGSYRTFILCKKNAGNASTLKKTLQKNFSQFFVIIDTKGIEEKKILSFLNSLEYNNILNSKGIIFLQENKPIWGLSDATDVRDWVVINGFRNAFSEKCNKITIEIENNFLKNYQTNNVVAFLKGNVKPDSFFVFVAHYDHLGKMGSDLMFPGANDNASGISLLLNLAKYYSDSVNTPAYSIVFIATSAEEIGLIGSDYFANHPMIPLEKIRFLFNFDLVGTGDDGIKVVNAPVFEKEFNILDSLNTKFNYLKAISKRGEAANSDHYPFYKKGVRSFYIYTLGGISEYHNHLDKSEALPLTDYSDLFKLITGFVKDVESSAK